MTNSQKAKMGGRESVAMSSDQYVPEAQLRSDGYVELKIERENVEIAHKFPKEDAEVVVEELQNAIDEWEATFG